MTKLAKGAVSLEQWRALEEGSLVHVRGGEARYALTGSGALACLQGLVTCDVSAAPDGSRLFGALLSGKGMIVAPLWIERRNAQHLMLETPERAAAALELVLAKSLPPRLCRWEDVSGTTAGVGFYGPGAAAPPSAALRAVVRGAPGLDAIIGLEEAAALTGARASDALLTACRIMAGIPALGAEIDDKTLPQEVRFDELGAVSYTKGCYLGQETVARVHFRGHPNRRLVFALLSQEPPDPPVELSGADGKVAGRLTSATWSEELDAWVGQAVVRREVEDAARLLPAGGGEATIHLDRWPREP